MSKLFIINMDVARYYSTTNKHVRIQKEDIEFKSKGIYMGEHHWQAGKTRAGEVLSKIVQRDIDWSTHLTMYRYSNLSLSRDKLSLMKEKYGTRVVRDRDSADVNVISEKTIEKIISADLYYGSMWSVKTFINKKLLQLSTVLTTEAHEYLEGLVVHLKPDDMIYGGDRYNSWNTSDEFQESPLKYFTESDKDTWMSERTSNGACYISNDNLYIWRSLNDPNKTFVSDVYVNEVCSEDSIALDWEQYENIKKMLGATSEDKSIAMTLMANCKIEESKTALGLLFYHHGDSMKGTNVWNQVAFKTLRKQFDHYVIGGWNSSHTSTFSSLIQKLAEDNALTEEAMKHVCQLVFEKVLTSGCGFDTDQCAFEMKLEDVRLTQHYKDKLKREDKTLSELVTVGDGLPF